MTVSSVEARKEYDGNGVTDAFATPYFISDVDLKVYVDGTLQTLSTDYTVAGAGVAGGGTVTFVTPPPTGDSNVLIVSDPPLTQELDLVENDRNPAEAREQAFDKLTQIAQRLRDLVNRSLRLADGDSTASLDLPLLAERASKFLAFNAEGGAIAADGTGTPASVFMATVLDDTSAAAARATLAAGGVHIAASRPAAADLNPGDLWYDSDYATGLYAVYYVYDPDTPGDDALISVIDTSSGVWLAPGNDASVSVDCSAGGTIALSTLQESYGIIVLSGTPAAAFTITVSTTPRRMLIVNDSGQTATIKTVSGTGQDIIDGDRRSMRCDGTNVVDTETRGALSEQFESGLQTITRAGTLSLPHGLTAAPILVQMSLVCQTAEAGYSIGDVLVIGNHADFDGGSSYGVALRVDSTNIDITYADQANVFRTLNAGTGVSAPLTNANWRLRVRAFV